ncbi:uncharacterized protein J5F26_016966 isoform 1-T2 [Ciconia maguari]
MKMLIMGQLVIGQEAKAVPKAEELRACFGLRKWSGAVDASYKPRRSGTEVYTRRGHHSDQEKGDRNNQGLDTAFHVRWLDSLERQMSLVPDHLLMVVCYCLEASLPLLQRELRKSS